MKKLLNAVPVLAEPIVTEPGVGGEARESTIPTQPNLERPAENRDSRGGVQKLSRRGCRINGRYRIPAQGREQATRPDVAGEQPAPAATFKQRRAAYARKYYHADTEKAHARNREQYQKHRAARLAARLARYHANPQQELEQKFRKYHNLQPGEQRDKRVHAPYGSCVEVRRAAALARSLRPPREKKPRVKIKPVMPDIRETPIGSVDKDWFRLKPQDIPGHWKP